MTGLYLHPTSKEGKESQGVRRGVGGDEEEGDSNRSGCGGGGVGSGV